MNDEKFRSLKVLKLKSRKGDEIIQTFWRIGPPPTPQKLVALSLMGTNFKSFRKDHTEPIEL